MKALVAPLVVIAILSLIAIAVYYVFGDSALDKSAKTIVSYHLKQRDGHYDSVGVARYNVDGKEISVEVKIIGTWIRLNIGIGPVTYSSQEFEFISTASGDACFLDKIFINDVEVPKKDITNFDQHQKNFEYYIVVLSNLINGSQNSILHSILR